MHADMTRGKRDHSMDRRQFIATVACNAAAFVLAAPVLSLASPAVVRNLSFYHTHTGKKLDIQYGTSTGYNKDALATIDQFLKDFRTGEVHPIDPILLDQLVAIRYKLGVQGTFEVISGFRSPVTNRNLRNKSSKVAKRSLHMKGQAIDIRLRGVQTRKLQQCALGLQRGGVGYYPKSDFVHIDTGRVRFW